MPARPVPGLEAAAQLALRMLDAALGPDGYADNVDWALPALQSRRLSAEDLVSQVEGYRSAVSYSGARLEARV